MPALQKKMSVVGIDFGSQSCYISVARAGGIETIANEYSDRCTPSYVSFNEKSRCMGISAKNQAVSNFRNTVYGFRQLLGRKFSDPQVQEEIKYFPFTVTSDGNDNIVIKVNYMNDVQSFRPEQMTAVLFTKLKETAEAALKTKIVDCVVSVPSHFTDAERRSLLDVTHMCGLNCLKLMNDTTAAALAYGIYKQDLPEEKEKSRNVVFVNMGYTSLQVCVCAFNKGKLKMLAVSSDPLLGGRDFDRVLRNYFAEDFRQRYKIDVFTKPKALIRLTAECEKVKKLMSATSQPVPINIECFMDDKDVSGNMNRPQFEEMCQPLLKRAEDTMKSILSQSKLHLDDLHSVEIVGGSTRIPAIKSIVKKIFGMEPSTTLNADEVIARGCALQCAILSPTFRVRDFSIADCQPYAITMTWTGGVTEDNSMEVFPRFHQFPFSKMLIFYRKEEFQLNAHYSPNEKITVPQPMIGSFKIFNIQPQMNGESSKVKVKVRINNHGIFNVTSASMVEKLDNTDGGESMDVDDKKDDDDDDTENQDNSKAADQNDTETPMQTEESPGKQAAGDKKEPANKKMKKIKMVDLRVESIVPQFSKYELQLCIERENQMIMQDRLEKDRADAKNAVEEYVYDMRDRLYGPLGHYVEESQRSDFSNILNDVENWLYDEGEDQMKQVYIDKLTSLKKLGNPICHRHQEAMERPAAFQAFGSVLQQIRKFLDLYLQKDERYNHIDQQDVKKVEKCLKEKAEWFERTQNQQNQRKSFEDPIVTCSEINSQRCNLESVCLLIINKPKPKVEPPKDSETSAKTNEQSNQQQPPPPSSEGSAQAGGEKPDPVMEVD